MVNVRIGGGEAYLRSVPKGKIHPGALFMGELHRYGDVLVLGQPPSAVNS